MDDPGAVLALVALAVAAVAVVAVLAVARSVRAAADRAGARQAEEQAATLRWVSDQLTRALDRFHTQLGAVSRDIGAAQGEAGAAVQRTVSERLDAMSARLDASQRALTDSLTGATDVFGQLQQRLGRVTEMAARVEQLAGSVTELGEILKVPKLRGLLGEQTLESMLRQVLPGRFWSVQHRFSDGRTVDAVVRLGDRLVPVDAKFPLEAYRRMVASSGDGERATARRDFARAVKVRVDEIATRYIRPAEDTVDFGLMFVPAEGVYAELVGAADDATGDLFDHALSRRVLPVSPATLYAYLSTVAVALRGIEVEHRAEEILATMVAMEQDVERLREELSTLGRHLHNAAQRHVEVERRLGELASRLARLGDGRPPDAAIT